MNKSYTFDTYLRETDDRCEIDVTVQFDYYPPSRGSRDRWGAPLEPDEPENIEITSVWYDGGEQIHDLKLTDIMDLEQKALEFLQESAAEYYDYLEDDCE